MRLRSFASVLALVAVAALCPVLHAQAKPNFSGEWTMVPEKSDFGPMAAPTQMTRVITHTEPSLKIVTTQNSPDGPTTINTAFSTDGKPANNMVNGSPMTTTGKWDGDTIVLTSHLTMQGMDIGIEDRYALSDGGKTLTVTRNFTTPDGPATAKIVLVKK